MIENERERIKSIIKDFIKGERDLTVHDGIAMLLDGIDIEVHKEFLEAQERFDNESK